MTLLGYLLMFLLSPLLVMFGLAVVIFGFALAVAIVFWPLYFLLWLVCGLFGDWWE